MNYPYTVAYRGLIVAAYSSLPEAVDTVCKATTSPGNLAQISISHIPSNKHWPLANAAHLCRQPILPEPNALSRFAPHSARWFSVIPFPHPIMPKGKWSANITYHSAEPTACFCIGDKPQCHWMFAPTPWQLSTADWNLTTTGIEGYDYFQPYAYPLNINGERLQGISGLTINHIGTIESVPWRGAMG